MCLREGEKKISSLICEKQTYIRRRTYLNFATKCKYISAFNSELFLPIHSRHHSATAHNATRNRAASPHGLLSGFLIICQIIFQFHSERSIDNCLRESEVAKLRISQIKRDNFARARSRIEIDLVSMLHTFRKCQSPDVRRKTPCTCVQEKLNSWKRKKSIP